MASDPGDREALASFVARSRIATNLARHSRGLDRNDRALLGSAYIDDAEVAYGMFTGPARAFAAMLTDAMAGAPVTLHRATNMAIRIDGDRARSESYVIAYTLTSEDGGAATQRLIGGRYLDRHEQRDGEWRIAHRTYVMDWNANVARRQRPLPAGVPTGRQGSADPSHGLFGARDERHEGGTRMDGVEEAIAKQALYDLVVRHASGTDRGDEATVAATLHDDAEVVTGFVDAAGADYARRIVAMVRGNLASSFHSIANAYFEVDGDRARGESYVVAHVVSAGEAAEETLSGGRYLDRFERRDGGWRIAQRTYVEDWNMSQPVTMATDGMYESLTTRGGWAPDDPSVAFWRGG